MDECGELVPAEIMEEATRRHVRLSFGPEQLQWSAITGRKGASIGIKNRARGGVASPAEGEGVKEMFPSFAPIPGGEGISADPQREDVRHFLQQLDVHNDEEKPRSRAVPYSDIAIMSAILANTVLMVS